MRKLGALGNISSVSSNISSTSPYPNGNWTSNAVANTKDILKVVLVKEVTQQILKVDGLKFNYEAPVVELGGWGRVDGESLGVTTATLKSAGVGCTTKGTIYSNYSASGYAGPAQVGFTVDSKGSLGNLSLISNGRYPDNWGTPNYAPTTWTRNESARSYSVGVYTSNNDSNYTKNQTITINESQQEFILDITSTSAFKYILFKIESSDTIATTMSLTSIGEHSITKLYIPTRRLPTKYYKYTYENWTQPVAIGQTTAIDGGNMVITATNQYSSAAPWRAMDGTTGSLWVMHDTTAGYWQLKLPYKICVTGLTFYNIEGGNKTRVARFYTGSDLSTPIGDQFTASSTDFGQTVVSNIPTGGIETDTIYLKISSSYGASSGMSELKITAKRRTGSVESTSSDYDYKVTEIKKYLPIRKFNDGTKRLYI